MSTLKPFNRVPSLDAPLRIESIRTDILDIPLIRPHRFSVTSIEKQSILLVRVRTSDGSEGIGEGVVPGGPWWGGDSIEGLQSLIDLYLAPLLIGEDVSRIDFLVLRMNKLIPGAAFAKAAVEMAFWDARGKCMGLPLYQLLGGAHRDRLPVTWALGADPAEIIVDEIKQKLATGEHLNFKLKMGASEPQQDVLRITSIAQALPANTALAVDLNGAWDEATSRRWLPVLAGIGISLIEQPVPRWNVEALARLSQQSNVPIMADESLMTVHDATALARLRGADVFSQKLAKSGGICSVTRIGIIAESYGIQCYGGTTIESSIGTAAAVHSFCASASLTAGTELFGPLLLADDIVKAPLRYADGYVYLNDQPGLGMSLDEEKVARYSR
jgi:muconate cycloisomerase